MPSQNSESAAKPHATIASEVSGPVQSRRALLSSGLGVTAAALVTSSFAGRHVFAASKTTAELITGEGAYTYRVKHHWPELPAPYKWQVTHNVAEDSSRNLYVIHEGDAQLKDHPSIFVFDDQGKFIRAFGSQFQGGGHGLEIRKEGSEEFVYVTAYQQVKSFAKLTLTGETVWEKRAPMECGHYAKGEATNPQKIWGRDRFMPTNYAFLDDGGFYLADGYGSFYIHRYDKDANWVSCFGGPGAGKGKFKTPHGLWMDRRGKEPKLVVADRANNTLQSFTVGGKYLDTTSGFGLPANLDAQGELLLVPELVARVSLLGPDNQVVARLGDDVGRISEDKGKKIRRDSKLWQDGKFVHPHDACFAADGSIFVAEWVGTGRVTKLERVS